MSDQSQPDSLMTAPFRIHRVSMQQPCAWIRNGWQDLIRHPGASLAHGMLVTGIGWVILSIVANHVYLLALSVSSFLLIGPILAAGLCELSRLDEQRLPASFDTSLDALYRNHTALWHFAFTLIAFTVVWFLISGLIVHVVFGLAWPTLGELTWGLLFEVIQFQQAVFFMLAGGLLALFVFMLSVVSVPAIIDQRMSAATAARMSIQAFAHNLPAMLIWAGFIVLFTAIGFITFLWAMIVVYPLLGHATWHAYRDLVS